MSILEFVQNYGGSFVAGTWITVAQFVFASIITILISIVAGLGKLSKNVVIRGVSVAYIELFRGTSLLVQLYWIFYVLPLLGVTLPKFVAGFLSVGLNGGAYGAELVRGAISAVPRGQWEACTALNMSAATRMRRIIMPQALTIMIPPWGNLLIELLKGTALVSLIAVTDLMFQAKQINASTYLSVQAFGTALIIYYVLSRFMITPFTAYIEKRVSWRHGKG
ncbi:ectoine/hydroxyectoine ABC transporter permease subunit EhuC [Sinorhizobium meliloti]|uniref:ectoine/hydroxyectoine ABC transporter permease subunit EhuC n=1 Tax=Rhizobium meliloti TaxID=382 RepID=UPI0020917D50|nr:ectoine/hydroxyectoine ABC transporter permease subunit EhuC [Sinorhizobium meliloti]MCO5966392.1 ectoine/hydroxyectoine ABC transporter permease subunit EhuC [Sinorhizobium meliloti]